MIKHHHPEGIQACNLSTKEVVTSTNPFLLTAGAGVLLHADKCRMGSTLNLQRSYDAVEDDTILSFSLSLSQWLSYKHTYTPRWLAYTRISVLTSRAVQIRYAASWDICPNSVIKCRLICC